MTAEEWENAARNSWITQIGRNNAPYVRRSYVPNNGYSTAPSQYNSYWSQRQNPYRRTDYTQPIQTSQTPPINQALNENFQPQYIQTTDYNGQPVRVPANAATPVRNTLNEYVVTPVQNFVRDKAAELIATGMAGSAGLAGTNMYGGSPLGAARLGIYSSPKISNAIAAMAATQYGRPFVNGVRSFVNNPYVQKADQALGKYGGWAKNLF